MNHSRQSGRVQVSVLAWTWVVAALCIAGIGCGNSGQPSTPDELVAKFQAAHAAKDVEGMMSLVCWKGVEDAAMREMMKKSFESFLESEVASVRYVTPVPAGTLTEYERGGIRYVPTVKPTGQIVIEFVKKPGSQGGLTRVSFLVGSENGVCSISTVAPAPK